MNERHARNLQLADFLRAHGYDIRCVAVPGTQDKERSADYLLVSFEQIPDQTEVKPVLEQDINQDELVENWLRQRLH